MFRVLVEGWKTGKRFTVPEKFHSLKDAHDEGMYWEDEGRSFYSILEDYEA